MQTRARSKPTLLRVGVTFSEGLSTKPDGGRHQAGLIAGVSVITGGPVPEHGVYVDDVFLRQVAGAINKGNGTKVRFGHPSVINDGTGTVIGTIVNATVTGSRVRADLHMLASGRKAPRGGDLGGYCLSLAAEAPDFLGISIAFEPDARAEEVFIREHSPAGTFRSPAPDNPGGLPHVRLKRLTAADLVDEPASNPGGLFDVLLPPITSKPITTPASRPPVKMPKIPGMLAAAEAWKWPTTTTTSTTMGGPTIDPMPASFTAAADAYARRHGIPLSSALSFIARTQPELYAAHVQAARDLALLRAQNRLLESQLQGRQQRRQPSRKASTSRRAGR